MRIVLVMLLACACCSSPPDEPQTLAVVGDSNVALYSRLIRDVVDADQIEAEYGASILPGRCNTICSSIDWTDHPVDAEVVLVNLGINDAAWRGGPDSQGFSSYGDKVSWLMELLPHNADIVWSNLPCDLEPPGMADGCAAVNAGLAAAADRWDNLTVADWAGAARPDHFANPGRDVHLNAAGARAWAELMADLVKARG
jgi:GDSL-like Lipase/Acylhydrolase family